MPVVRGKDVKFERSDQCGCMIARYIYPSIRPGKHLHDFLVVKRKLSEERDWSMQKHLHKTMPEYWFIIEGEGEVTEDDKSYRVKKGDLVITPPGTRHKIKGDVTFVCFVPNYNENGKLAEEDYFKAVLPYVHRPPGHELGKK